MIIPIPHKSYPLPSPFPQNQATQVQLFQVGAIDANPWNTSAQTIPIIIVPPVDELPWNTQIISALNFIAFTMSSMVTPVSSIPTPCPPTTSPSWTQPGTFPIMRSTREIEVLEMKLQDYEEANVIDIWDPLPFSPLPPFPPSHTLWGMIMNNVGISAKIWDQFVGSNVLSITF